MTDGAERAVRTPRGPYAKTAEVRERIAVAAADVFARLGFRAATFKEIASEAGVSERGIVYHFPTKGALLIAVLDHHEAAIGRSGEVQTDDGARTLAWVLRNIAEDPPALVELHTQIAAESLSPDHPAHERYAVRYDDFRRFVGLGFERLDRAQELRVAAAPELLAAGLIALMDGLQLQWLREPAIDVQGVIDAYLAGVLAPTALDRVRRFRAADAAPTTTAS